MPKFNAINNDFNDLVQQTRDKKLEPVSTGMSTATVPWLDSSGTQQSSDVSTAPVKNEQQQPTQTNVNRDSEWAWACDALLNPDQAAGDSILNSGFARLQTPGDKLYTPNITANNVHLANFSSMNSDYDFTDGNGISREQFDQMAAIFYDYDNSGFTYNTGDSSVTRVGDKVYRNIAAPTGQRATKDKAKQAAWDYQKMGNEFQKIADRENETRMAEDELVALQEYFDYWTGRTDLNLSDDYIIRGITWKDYPTLEKIKNAADNHFAIELNRPVNFSTSTIEGMLWKSRNQELDTGNAQYNAINAAMGVGNTWKYNQDINPYLAWGTETYNPYYVKSTMDDMCQKYNVTEFTSQWVTDNTERLSRTEEGRKDLARINDAINKYTEPARKEAEMLTQWVIEQGRAHNEINWKEIFGDHYLSGSAESFTPSTLKTLYNTLGTEGDGYANESAIKDTAGAIKFDMNELKRIYNRELNSSKELEDAFTEVFGEAVGYSGEDDVNKMASAAISKYRDVLLSRGTKEDRDLFAHMGKETDPARISEMIERYVDSGWLTQQDAVQLNYRVAEDFKADNYLTNAWIAGQYDYYTGIANENKEKLKSMGLEYDPNRNGERYFHMSEEVSSIADEYGYTENGRRGYKPIQGEEGSVADKANYLKWALETTAKQSDPNNADYVADETQRVLDPDELQYVQGLLIDFANDPNTDWAKAHPGAAPEYNPREWKSWQEYADHVTNLANAAGYGERERYFKEWNDDPNLKLGNVEFKNNGKLSRVVIKASKLADAGWDVGEEEYDYNASTYSMSFGYDDVTVTATPITKDGDVLSPKELDEYLGNAVSSGNAMAYDARHKGLIMEVSNEPNPNKYQWLHEWQDEQIEPTPAEDAAQADLDSKLAFLEISASSPTFDDMIAEMNAGLQLNGIYSAITNADMQAEKYSDDQKAAHEMLDKINQMSSDALAYGVEVYGTPIIDENGNWNDSAITLSRSGERSDNITGVCNALLMFGGMDVRPAAGQIAARYQMILDNNTDGIRAEIAAKNGVSPEQVTPLMAEVEAYAYLADELKKLKTQQEKMSTLDRIIEVYGINVEGIDAVEGQRNSPYSNYQAAKQDVENAIYYLETALLARSDDFDTVVSDFASNGQQEYGNTGHVRDAVMHLTNAIDPMHEAYAANDPRRYMTNVDWEKYAYLYEKEGAEAAEEYFNRVTAETGSGQVYQRYVTQGSASALANDGLGGAIVGSGVSVLMAPFQALGAFYGVGQGITGQEINEWNPAFNASVFSTTVRGEISNNIEEAYGPFWSWLYNTSMSGADSLLNSAITGPFVGGIMNAGLTTGAQRAFKILGSALSSSLMGAEAMGTQIWSAMMDGAHSDTALILGGITFACETATEAFSMENIFRAGHNGTVDGLKTTFKEFLKNAVSPFELVSESVGEAVSEIGEQWADAYFNGDNSQYMADVQKYINMGLPREQAQYRAFRDAAQDVLLAGVSGAVMSVGTAGVSYGAGLVKSGMGSLIYGKDNYMSKVYAQEGARLDGNLEEIQTRLETAKKELEKHDTPKNRKLVETYETQERNAKDQITDWTARMVNLFEYRLNSNQDLAAELANDVDVSRASNPVTVQDANGFEAANIPAVPVASIAEADARETAERASADKKALAMQAEADAKAAADKVFEDGRAKAQAKYDEALRKADEARKKTVANTKSEPAKKGAVTKFVNKAAQLDAEYAEEIRTLEAARDAAHANAAETRQSAEAEADRILQEAIAPKGAPANPAQAADESDAANGIQIGIERFQQALTRLTTAAESGDVNAINAAKTDIHGIIMATGDALNLIKANAESMMEQTGTPTEVQQERIAAAEDTMAKMQAIADYLNGETQQAVEEPTPTAEELPTQTPEAETRQENPEAVPVQEGTLPEATEAGDIHAEPIRSDTATPEESVTGILEEAPETTHEAMPEQTAETERASAEQEATERTEGTAPVAEEVGTQGTAGFDLNALIAEFQDAAGRTMDSIRGALDYMRAQQEAADKAKSDINARAKVLDAYNAVRDLINRAKAAYEDYLAAKAAKDDTAKEDAQAKVETAFTELGNAWQEFYNARAEMKGEHPAANTNAPTGQKPAANPFIMASVALEQAAASGNEALQFSTVAGVMTRRSEITDTNAPAYAGAATQAMFSLFGADSTMQGIKHAIGNAYTTGVGLNQIKSTIQTLALGDEQNNSALRQLFNGEIDAKEAVRIANDSQDKTEEILKRKLEDYKKAVELRRLIGQGGLDVTEGSKANLDHANAQVEEAQGLLDKRIQERDSRFQELQDAMAEYDRALNMTDREASSGTSGATGKSKALDAAASAVASASQLYGNAITVANEYQQKLANAQQARAAAQKQYDTLVAKTMRDLRAQAAMNVQQANAENDQRVAEQRAARNAQAKAEAQQAMQTAAEAAQALANESDRARANAERIAGERAQNTAENGGEQDNLLTGDRMAVSGDTDARVGFAPHLGENAEGEAPKGTPKNSPYHIARTLAKALNIGEYIGTRQMNGVDRRTLGYYQRHADYVAVRSSEAGNYGVTMHEIGHAVQRRIGIEVPDSLVQAMMDDPNGLDVSQYNDEQLRREAFAEFFWRYMESEERARLFAGDDFTDQFELGIRTAGIENQVHDAAEQMRMWAHAPALERMQAIIKHKDTYKEDKSVGQRIRDGIRRVVARDVDVTSAAERVLHKQREQTGQRKITLEEDLRAQSVMKQFSAKRAWNLLTGDLTDSKWNRIGDGLSKMLEKTGIRADEYDLMEKLLLALHSQERARQGKPVFDDDTLSFEDRDKIISDIIREHPNVFKAAQAFQEFREKFLQFFMVDTGFWTQETFDLFNKINPWYVPTRRVMSDKSDNGMVQSGAKKYEVKRATGGTQDVWSPIDTFMDMVNSIVTMVSNNNAALAWDAAYQKYEGFGEFGRLIGTEEVAQNTEALQKELQRIIKNAADTDVVDEVIAAMQRSQNQYTNRSGTSVPNVITVQRPDGTKALYQMKDMELYKLLASANESCKSNFMDGWGKLTKTMSALTTGSNPVFALRNFLRDFQNSVNYGSWASNYITGFGKWLATFWDVWRADSPILEKFGVNRESAFQDYMALGGGGYNRIDTGTKRGAREMREALVSNGANTKNAGSIGRYIGKKLWNGTTLAKLNEIVEQTSRFAEYKYGKHDLTTQEGRTEAFLAAQDVTVDFARRGYGVETDVFKKIIPFFNASMQGVYRTARMFTEGERDRAAIRFTKTVLNTSITSAICAALLKGFLDDDAEKEFRLLSDQLKAGHFYLPNLLPQVFGEAPLIRIPLEQDPLAIAVHGTVTDILFGDGKDADEIMIPIAAIADAVLDNINPIGSTIFDPIVGVLSNKTWYGSPITPTRYDGKTPTLQYSEDIPDAFVWMADAMDAVLDVFGHGGEGLNAFQFQYLTQQYTGFLGQMGIPALTKENGRMGGVGAALEAARKRLTSDPLLSNDAIGAFYDAKGFLDDLPKAFKEGRLNKVMRGADAQTQSKAASEAEGLNKGVIAPVYKQMTELNKQIDNINSNANLTEHEKYVQTSALHRQILKLVLSANEQIGAYYDKYIRTPSIVNSLIFGDYHPRK